MVSAVQKPKTEKGMKSRRYLGSEILFTAILTI